MGKDKKAAKIEGTRQDGVDLLAPLRGVDKIVPKKDGKKDDSTSSKKAKKSGKDAKPSGKKAAKLVKKAEKRADEAEKELKAARRQVAVLGRTVDKLEAKVDTLESKAGRWKDEAREGRTRIAKLEAKLRRARRDAPVDHLPPSERGDLPVEDDVVELPADVAAAGLVADGSVDGAPDVEVTAVETVLVEEVPSADGVDHTWTVTRLRAEARGRGIVGASRMTKARLLDALR